MAAVHFGFAGSDGAAQALQFGQLERAVMRVDQLPRLQTWAVLNSLRG